MRNRRLWLLPAPLCVVAYSLLAPALAGTVTPESLKNSLQGAGAPTQEAFQKVGCTVMGVFVTEDTLRFLFAFLFILLLGGVAGAFAFAKHNNDVLDWSRLLVFIVLYFVAIGVIYFVVRSWFGCPI